MASFLFTIEQIELVRRLRKTGLTKEQVWRAYEEMDRLDAELNVSDNSVININNSVNNSLKTNNSQLNITANNNNNNNNNSLQLNQMNFNPNNESCNKSLTVCLPLVKSSQSIQSLHSLQSLQSQSNSLTMNPMNPMEKSSVTALSLPSMSQSFNLSNMNAMAVKTTHIDVSDEESIKESSVTITPIPVTQTQVPEVTNTVATVSHKPEVSIYYPNEEPQELLEFKKKGETVMLNEIRAFVNKYNIRQIMIAEMTKISQGYVSRFFRGEGQDMSDKSKNLIYLWYITCRNRPEILTQYCPQTIGERRTQLSEAGDLLPIRRDRFIFRREHLLVLDKYFKENPYPDASTKEMIAEECNTAIEILAKRSLKERDKVTISVVSNWFNNKRKEAKNKRLPQNQSYSSCESTQMSANQSLPYATETSIYSNHSNASVEELETRPDMSILTDFENHDSIDISDDDSQHSYTTCDRNFLNKEIKPNFVIKLEPTF